MPSLLDLPPLKLVHTTGYSPVLEVPEPLEIPFDDYGLNLPAIGVPVGAVAPRIADVLNPGTSSPLTQNMGRRLSVDQTMSVSGAGGPLITSDGQMQIADHAGGAGQRGVTVTRGFHAPLQNSDGNVQLPNVAPTDYTTTSEQRPGGLPLEAMPDSQNAARLMRSTAVSLPVAINVKAGENRPGKLPTTHMIR